MSCTVHLIVSFIVGGLNCFFTQWLLNLLFTQRREILWLTDNPVTLPRLCCMFWFLVSSTCLLFLIFLGGKVEVTPRLKFLPVNFPSIVHPFHVFCCVPQMSLRIKFRWALDFSWPVPNQVSNYQQKPGANFLGSFLLRDLKDISIF